MLRAEPSETKREHYLDDIEHDLADYGATNKTGNPTLDTVLTSKSLYCAHHHIELTCVAQGEVLDKVGISEMDIAAMFGNALDNAIEYCETLDDPGQRLIRVVVRQVRGFAFIAVENKIASADAARLQTRNGLPRSTKGDDRYHGFGLKSIQSLTRQYGGELSVKAENDWFKVHITIPIPASQKQR
ncbi:ATP-binding protein [Bifidobacterium sp. ESL0798]|uniref:ATP-binding protein n=1 Tax=Bifidobacterium sp. ESL0798 TaxID=2983235 RepID=UPI0023FA2812|nr:ATP-binding protein [Bifidobacterium sp. ESL0798]WEV74677.1 ATP-binding protein [Bifidobacterium sp. ESL0798]